jgi:hypothetical protein
MLHREPVLSGLFGATEATETGHVVRNIELPGVPIWQLHCKTDMRISEVKWVKIDTEHMQDHTAFCVNPNDNHNSVIDSFST